ncbi:MAG: hypothetical protein M5T61_13720 [Acidimicrobiia bacterium]|nr:hypothetical protein [Acidimicrobiia bacterium]
MTQRPMTHRPDLQTFRSIGDALAGLVGVLDPDLVPLPEAARWWEALDRIERLAAGAKTLLARRVEESGAWERSGVPVRCRAPGAGIGDRRRSRP